ncbi:hypothetical protein HY407_00240 [Candidatus Gottesmanbacteria bacterium]|nr:hypothetical protein [Candidatus Gottesmanbacteria bacterium]
MVTKNNNVKAESDPGCGRLVVVIISILIFVGLFIVPDGSGENAWIITAIKAIVGVITFPIAAIGGLIIATEVLESGNDQ